MRLLDPTPAPFIIPSSTHTLKEEEITRVQHDEIGLSWKSSDDRSWNFLRTSLLRLAKITGETSGTPHLRLGHRFEFPSFTTPVTWYHSPRPLPHTGGKNPRTQNTEISIEHQRFLHIVIKTTMVCIYKKGLPVEYCRCHMILVLE